MSAASAFAVTHRHASLVCVLAAFVLAFFMTYNQGRLDGYISGRCEAKCGLPPTKIQRDARYPPSAMLVCTCPNGDVWRLAE